MGLCSDTFSLREVTVWLETALDVIYEGARPVKLILLEFLLMQVSYRGTVGFVIGGVASSSLSLSARLDNEEGSCLGCDEETIIFG